MKLVIVESPTKSRTLSGFLDSSFKVMATKGHVRDLPEKSFGVKIDEGFKITYVWIKGKKEVMDKIKKEAQRAETVILATDPDREGEAIAWHVLRVLKIPENKYQRIVFHEITKEALLEALKTARKIDLNLVNAQQARRVLDRIVGYKLSPFLWKKVARGLSAGRVQSVALRLIVDREKEIEEFVPQEYWTIEALFATPDNKSLKAILSKIKGKSLDKFHFTNREQVEKEKERIREQSFKIKKIEKRKTKRTPPPPFITSTLQQEAFKRLGFAAKTTMAFAQRLFEAGLITYHRTDSTSLSQEAVNKAREFIGSRIGKEYLPEKPHVYKSKSKLAQEAHEAIRPTDVFKTPEEISKEISEGEAKLYDLIWKRFVACQMKEALLESTKVEIEGGEYTFTSTGQILQFEGFLKIYPLALEEQELPPLKEGEPLELEKLEGVQHFTQPPSRYTEATLIKELEKNGVGRPSTYATIVSILQERGYVKKDEKKRFYPTEIGKTVAQLLKEHFPEIVDVSFTAKMEEDLDRIAQGKEDWKRVLEEFYSPFSARLQQKYQEVKKHTIETDKSCPECGNKLVIRIGRHGRFYGCSNWPKCTFTKNIPDKTLGIKCPRCEEGELVEKRSRKGKVFYGCANWPDCDFVLWDKPLDKKCSKCGSLLVEKKIDRKKIAMCPVCEKIYEL